MRLVLPVLLTLVACAKPPEALKRLDAPAFQAAVATGQGLVLDVRTLGEHQQARLKVAQKHIPVQELARRLEELPADKTQPLLLYCRSGNRSVTAAEILLKAGYTDVRHLEGGIGAWKGKGLPVEP